MSADEHQAPVRVGNGPIGRGVFATRDIAEGELIEICPTLEVPDSDIAGRLRDYILTSNHDEAACVLMLGYGVLYNHSTEPSAEYREHGELEIAFYALRPIPAGEEILISYGDEWWETRDLAPD